MFGGWGGYSLVLTQGTWMEPLQTGVKTLGDPQALYSFLNRQNNPFSSVHSLP